MSERTTYKLGDLGTFIGGVSSIKKDDYGHGTPFLPYKNVYKNSKVNINELELMNVKPAEIQRRGCVYGDIFFTASSETPDEVAMSSVLLDEVENLTFNGFCKRYRLHDFNTLLPEYARYLFRSPSFRREVYQVATGDIRFNISQESLGKIEIEIPDVETQKELADILTSIDDKIELNLQMNQTLEAMAQAIFKEWFVNFNFPGFDGELVDGLPKGWRNATLRDVLAVKNGYAFKGTDFINEGVPVIKIKNVKPNRILITDLSFVSREVADLTQKYRIRKDDILITMSGNRIDGTPETWVGKVAMFNRNGEYLLNQRVSILDLKEENKKLKYYLTLLLSSQDFQYFFITNATSSGGQANISPDLIYKTELVLPEKGVIDAFFELANSIFEKMNENELANDHLVQARDMLLPKLINGKIEIQA